MAVGVETQAMSEGRLRAKLFFGYALDEANEPTVSIFKLSSNLGQRKTFLPFRHDPIEGIDSTMCHGVSLWFAPFENGRQVFSASFSQVVTWTRMSRSDQLPVTPGFIICKSDNPVCDSRNSRQAFSSRVRSCP